MMVQFAPAFVSGPVRAPKGPSLHPKAASESSDGSLQGATSPSPEEFLMSHRPLHPCHWFGQGHNPRCFPEEAVKPEVVAAGVATGGLVVRPLLCLNGVRGA